jgi:uncharacterized membrane protein
MLNMAKREQRKLDAMLLGSPGQGNAFFASTRAIAVGGIAATLGSGDRLQLMLASLPFASPAPAMVLEAKQVFFMGIFMLALFKFAWAFRISHYAARARHHVGHLILARHDFLSRTLRLIRQ